MTFLNTIKRITAGGIMTALLVGVPASAATPSTAVIVREMWKNLEKVNSAAFSASIKIDEKTTYSAQLKKEYSFYEDSNSSVQVDMSGFIDSTEEGKQKMYITVDIPGSNPGEKTGTVQLIALEEDLYVNVDLANPASFLKFIGMEDVALNGQWIHVNEQSITDLYRTLGMDINAVVPSALARSEVSDAQAKAIMKAVKDSGVLSFTKVQDAAADRQGNYHLRVVINKGRIVSLVNRVMKVMGQSQLTRTQVRELEREIKVMPSPKIDLFVGKSDYALREVSYVMSNKSASSFGYTTNRKVTFTLTMNGYNVPVSIAAPTPVKELTDIISGIMSQWERKERDNQRVNDLETLEEALSDYFNIHDTDPAGENIVLGVGGAACLNEFGWQASGCANPYLVTVPKDPGTGKYVYSRMPTASGTTYIIDAEFEGSTTFQDWYTDKIVTLKGPIRLNPYDGVVTR